ncbi:STM4015 family protein [Streptomyces sp. NRRL S-495]|uniref:STM4015 family protein n=1 Tax=Streptomyces sp. NRRL S-495 TaxID=1609133 RepID=UPI0005F8E63D|nr:STM4015 family protein [Streptomyces sp. NRRL S-495]KJY35040.1 cytoplasmic protein [Streptomyces sp. NRRL S-495]
MTVNNHIEDFHGLPVFDFVTAVDAGGELPEPGAVAWKIGIEFDSEQDWPTRWGQFLDRVDTSSVTAVVVGEWSCDGPVSFAGPLAALLGAADRLPALRGLFIGDITYEENEISWIEMVDVTPVLTTFPLLTELVVRGASGEYAQGTGMALQPLRHEHLRALRFESGGLPGEVPRAVAASELPALERLEFWLGVQAYGGTTRPADLDPFLDGGRFPALRHLGLQNSEFQDEIAAAVAHAPVVARLESLNLSMGVFTDEGATALLDGQPLTHLKRLDLHHHYLSQGMQQRLREALAGVELDLSEAGKLGDRWQYVAVAE